ncbi:hypothetical protein WA158_005959 [Blastocystis sp. Blastoise]
MINRDNREEESLNRMLTNKAIAYITPLLDFILSHIQNRLKFLHNFRSGISVTVNHIFSPTPLTVYTLFTLLISFLQSYKYSSTSDSRKFILTTISSLIPLLSSTKEYILLLSNYLYPSQKEIVEPSTRMILIEILTRISQAFDSQDYQETLYEVDELNGYNHGRMDDMDFGRRGDAYNRINKKGRLLYYATDRCLEDDMMIHTASFTPLENFVRKEHN